MDEHEIARLGELHRAELDHVTAVGECVLAYYDTLSRGSMSAEQAYGLAYQYSATYWDNYYADSYAVEVIDE